MRLDGHDGRTVTLPRSYLEGRFRGARNRRVDLAYATTGHRAQGLTRGRALVRLTGTEDVNWLYVQLSRARQDTRLYAVVGPEPQGAGELDLPDRDQPDAYLQLAQACPGPAGRPWPSTLPAGQTCSGCPRSSCGPSGTGFAASWMRHPATAAASWPVPPPTASRPSRRWPPYQQPAGRPPTGMLGWLRRGDDQPTTQVPGGLAVATQQANRAYDRERELRQHQQRRAGWLEANTHLGPQYRQVVRALAWQRRATGLAVEADRPSYVLEALGPVPESTRAGGPGARPRPRSSSTGPLTTSPTRSGPSAARVTTQASGSTGSGPAWPLSGSRPSSAPPTAAATSRRPASAPLSRDLTSRVAGQGPSGPPASTTRREHPNGQPSTLALRRRG
jgi:hypothetical protein